MATVALNQYQKRQFGGGNPYGNVSNFVFAFTTNSSGAAVDSDSTSALAIGDVLDLGLLQEGMRLDDASIFIANAMKASVTCSLGFKYEDGVDDSNVPQDAAYFGTSLALSSTGRVRANTGKLLTLPKPARLIMTFAGANNDEAIDIKVLVTSELTGAR